jgi:predicted DNA-binding protein with PD1-like motif
MSGRVSLQSQRLCHIDVTTEEEIQIYAGGLFIANVMHMCEVFRNYQWA